MAQQNQTKGSEKLTLLLWVASGVLLIGLLIARAVYPELLGLTIAVSIPLVVSLGILIRENQKALRSRTGAYGLNSAVTIILVLGIVGVLNFVISKHPLKVDLTKNKLHTLSDQTVKIVKEIDKPIKGIFFSKIQQREQFGALLENYKSLNPKFEVEYVDPDREPTRAKEAGLKKIGTLQLFIGARDTKIEDPNEEKVTNGLLKLLKEKTPTICATTGHGEKSFTSQDADGYSSVRKSLMDQAYEVKELNLLQEGKIPETCDAIAIMGPTKSFFPPEAKLIKEFLDNGGKGIFAVDLNLKGGEYSPELNAILAEWYIKAIPALIVDPFSRMLGVDSSVAILAEFNHFQDITREFQSNCAFPLSRPLEAIKGAPTEINVQWIAKSTPKSWAVTDLREIAKGQVAFVPGKDLQGPLTTVMTVDGKQKDSKAQKKTRIVVFGSSIFPNNNYSRFMGNSDFFLNSVSWAMEDESLISIRTKEDTPGKIELSQKAGVFVFILSFIIIPISIAAAGVAIWAVRRRL